MSQLLLSQALSKRFKEQVENEQPKLTEKVHYDNAPFTKPNADKFWAKCNVKPEEPFRVTVGDNPRQRTPGLLVVSLFGPLAIGDKEITLLADAVADAFRNTSVDGVVYRVPAPVIVGETEDGWWQMNVNCPFYFDEFL